MRRVVLGSLLLVVWGCGDITVASSVEDAGSQSCKTDDDCADPERPCLVSSCSTAGECAAAVVKSGWCYAGDQCYQPGQEQPGNRCNVCDPDTAATAFTAVSCSEGSCDPTSGQCVVEADTVEPTDEGGTADGGVEDGGVADTVEGDGMVADVSDGGTVTDEGADTGETPDAGADGGAGPCVTNVDCQGAIALGTCEAAVCLKATGECVAVDALPGTACVPQDVASGDCWKGVCDDVGECGAEPLTNTGCDDENPCTLGDICQEGACVGAPKDCGDGNPCTVDACDPETGDCDNATPAEGSCEDGNLCTADDTCVQGICVAGANQCACQADVDCEDDGDLCNGTLACVDGACVVAPESVVVCDTASDGPCQSTACAPTGDCLTTVLQGATCDDGDACTFGDACDATGGCAGAPMPCDDGNVCTQDACVAGECVYEPGGSACSDGDPCTADDVCNGGLCMGNPKVCDDGNACTVDFCGDDGVCVFEAQEGQICDDGNPCTGGDVCAGIHCAGVVVDCDDGNACTDDACDPLNPAPGWIPMTPETACTYTDNQGPCSDGDACTTADTCAGGSCHGGPPANCAVDVPCVEGICDIDTGCGVISAPVGMPCDDGNPCTMGESCQADASCGVGDNICTCQVDADCDDQNPCNGVETCQDSGGGVLVCAPGQPMVCPQTASYCLVSVCNPLSGICQEGPANDGNACGKDTLCETGRVCDGGVCKGALVVCPVETCMDMTGCLETVGCQYTASGVGTPCDDGSQCTTGDQCNKKGVCTGSVMPCDDQNPCTADGCDPISGCLHKTLANGTSCDSDGNACTPESCSNGQCTAQLPKKCSDGVACTVDSCDPVTGACIFVPDNGLCDDKNPCTQDVCTANGCSHVAEADFTACSDGSAKSQLDFCFQGACSGSGVLTWPVPLSLCGTSNVMGVDIETDGSAFYAVARYSTLTYGIAVGSKGGCGKPQFTRSPVYKIVGPSATLISNASGVAAGMSGSVIYGDAGLTGVLAAGGTAVTWEGNNVESGLAQVDGPIANIHAADHRATTQITLTGLQKTDWLLLAGRTSQGMGWATRCSGLIGGKGVMNCVPLAASGGASPDNQDFAAATLTTTYKALSGSVSEQWLVSNSVDNYTDFYRASGSAATEFLSPFSIPGNTSLVGAVAVNTGELLAYGASGWLYRCLGGECMEISGAPDPSKAINWVDGYDYSAGTVLLGAEPGAVVLAFLPTGADAASPDSWIVQRLFEVPGAPVGIAVTPSKGLVVMMKDPIDGMYAAWTWWAQK